MKQKELKFDLDAMREMKTSLSETASELKSYKIEVIEALDRLKENWKTAEGKKVMSDIDNNWTAEVEKYIKIIGAVESLLEEAITQYIVVEEEIDNLKFYT